MISARSKTKKSSRIAKKSLCHSDIHVVEGPDLLLKPADEGSGSGSCSNSAEEHEKKELSGPALAAVLNSKSRSAKIKKIKLKKITNWSGCNGALLDDEPYYHGYMSRDESERLVRSQGDFLLRKAELVNKGEVVVLTVYWDNDYKHLNIEQARNLFYLKEFCFENISDLIRYHHQNQIEVHYSGIKLFTWVVREEWQLYHEQIELGKKLGNGEFGEVFQGVLSQGVFTKEVDVAVKTMKASKVTADEKITFLREANLMLKLHHKYVVRLYGVATQKEPIMIVMEVCAGGSLKGKIDGDPISSELKRKYCKQIAKGMRYLEKKQVIHRDLAARNCLLDKSDNCKISDFGLSLLGKSHKEHKMLKVPVRWLAPETLKNGVYSSKSDVWSYGVVMYEVFSQKYPYHAIKVLREVRMKVLDENLRLIPPDDMPKEDSDIMNNCFQPVETRPSFSKLCARYRETTTMFPSLSGFATKFGIRTDTVD